MELKENQRVYNELRSRRPPDVEAIARAAVASHEARAALEAHVEDLDESVESGVVTAYQNCNPIIAAEADMTTARTVFDSATDDLLELTDAVALFHSKQTAYLNQLKSQPFNNDAITDADASRFEATKNLRDLIDASGNDAASDAFNSLTEKQEVYFDYLAQSEDPTLVEFQQAVVERNAARETLDSVSQRSLEPDSIWENFRSRRDRYTTANAELSAETARQTLARLIRESPNSTDALKDAWKSFNENLEAYDTSFNLNEEVQAASAAAVGEADAEQVVPWTDFRTGFQTELEGVSSSSDPEALRLQAAWGTFLENYTQFDNLRREHGPNEIQTPEVAEEPPETIPATTVQDATEEVDAADTQAAEEAERIDRDRRKLEGLWNAVADAEVMRDAARGPFDTAIETSNIPAVVRARDLWEEKRQRCGRLMGQLEYNFDVRTERANRLLRDFQADEEPNLGPLATAIGRNDVVFKPWKDISDAERELARLQAQQPPNHAAIGGALNTLKNARKTFDDAPGIREKLESRDDDYESRKDELEDELYPQLGETQRHVQLIDLHVALGDAVDAAGGIRPTREEVRLVRLIERLESEQDTSGKELAEAHAGALGILERYDKTVNELSEDPKLLAAEKIWEVDDEIRRILSVGGEERSAEEETTLQDKLKELRKLRHEFIQEHVFPEEDPENPVPWLDKDIQEVQDRIDAAAGNGDTAALEEEKAALEAKKNSLLDAKNRLDVFTRDNMPPDYLEKAKKNLEKLEENSLHFAVGIVLPFMLLFLLFFVVPDAVALTCKVCKRGGVMGP